MPANSLSRRVLKKIFFPLLNERSYRVIQGTAKAWDILTGSWYEPELDLVPFTVRPGDTVLDIGANYGFYSFHLSRAVGPSGRVYAFEPVPFTHATLALVAKILQFKNVEIVPKGCSDRNGIVSFTLPVQHSGPLSAGLAHLGQRNNERSGKGTHFPYEKTREILCDVIALDDFLPKLRILSFIKCDIEGAELLAFRGAERMIREHRPTVLCEINPWFLEGFGIQLQELVEFFFEKGYQLYRYVGQNKRGKLKVTTPEEVVEDNFLFVHPQRLDRLIPLLDSS